MSALEEIDPNIPQMSGKKEYQRISNEVRQLIINQMDKGMTTSEAAAVFEVKYTTVSKIYCKYRKTGQILKKTKGGNRRQLLSDDMKNFLCDEVDNDCTLRLVDLKTKLLDRYRELETVSLKTIALALKDFHYSFKRVTLVPERRNSEEVIENRYRYALEYNRLIPEKNKLFFIDEFGCQISSRAKYGRSMRGTKCHKTVPQIRSRTYSVCAAMNEESLYFFEIQDQSYNTNHFGNFLTQLFGYFARDGITGAHMIMDNVRFHHQEEIVNLITAHGHHVLFLPPYSPFMNPIEELFHQWKASIRRKECQNTDQLYEEVNRSSGEITADNCRNYVRHMESYLFLCLNRNIIES